MRHIASSSSSFLFKKFFKPVTEPVSVSFFVFFACGRAFEKCAQVRFSFHTLPATLVPRDFLLFHECINRSSDSAETSTFAFTCSQASREHPEKKVKD